MSDFDTMLWRPLHSGNEYEALFPKSKCKSTYVGTGNTDLSISEMEKVILDNAQQTELIAQKLQKSNIQATVQNIHNFLFNHFQYKADESNQLLRSPACSWYTRKDGIDCKSYSILASSILLNLNITNYVRKIKQPGFAPNDFTHVYVIVPKNQKTGSLNDGYYVIDGTLKSNIEPAFVGKKDLFMDGLKHYSLNAPFENQNLNQGLGIGFSDVKGFFGNFNFNNLTSFFNNIKCWGGSALSQGEANQSIENIKKYYNELFADLNAALQAKDYVEFSKIAHEFKGSSTILLIGSQRKLADGWNPCTTSALQGIVYLNEFFRNNLYPLFQAYLNNYFEATPTQTMVLFHCGRISVANGIEWSCHDNEIMNLPLVNYVPRPMMTQIPKFEFNQYATDKVNANLPIDFAGWKNAAETLGNFIQIFKPNTNPNPNNGGGYVNQPGTEQPLDPSNPINPSDKPSTMGSWLIGGAIAVVGLGLVLNKK